MPTTCPPKYAFEVQKFLVGLDNLLFCKRGTVARIFQRLPDDVSAGIVKFVFDYNQVTVFVQSQQIQAFFGVVKAIELFLDNQQFFPQRIGRIGQPFLQMVTFFKSQFGKRGKCDFNNPIGIFIDLIHGPPLLLRLWKLIGEPLVALVEKLLFGWMYIK